MHEKEANRRQTRDPQKASPVSRGLVKGRARPCSGSSYADRLAAYRTRPARGGNKGEKESAPAPLAAILTPRRIAGLYALFCNPTGHVYIGASADLPWRYKTHFERLRIGSHSNRRLQSLFDKHGESAFSFVPMFAVRLTRAHGFPDKDWIWLGSLGKHEKEWLEGLKEEIGELLLNGSPHHTNGQVERHLSIPRKGYRVWWPPFPAGGPIRVRRLKRLNGKIVRPRKDAAK